MQKTWRILNSRIEKVYFGAYDVKSGCAGSKINLLDMNLCNYTTEVVGGVLQSECSEIIKNFFGTLRNKS